MPWPTSPLFTVRETATSGRGVFANQLIPTGTHLLTCPDLAYGIVFREYRREVCNWCFAYEQGDILPVRENRAALVWCTDECKDKWLEEHGEIGVEAYAVVEDLARRQAKSVAKDEGSEEDSSSSVAQVAPEPTLDDVDEAWKKAELAAEQILEARRSSRPSKSQRKALAKALETKLESMIINHAISGILASRNHPDTWITVEELYASPQPYNTFDQLQAHLSSYLHLLALLPLELLPYCTKEVMMTSLNRDSHNSFGIRSLDDDASEMFGYGTWPSASYWNHSCSPNIRKVRVAREWTFTADREVQEGEELCITYIGGEEKELGVAARREELEKAWKFTCGCKRCRDEAGEVDDEQRKLE